MTKQHFIALADAIKDHNLRNYSPLNHEQIEMLCRFCATQNPNFKRDRWLDYIAGKCGKNGGAIKA